MDLPVFDITLDNWSEGIFATSLVEQPAIESDFIFMGKDKREATFVFADEEKREVVGAVLVPDKLIYRRDADGNEFFVRFTKEIIMELNQKMHEYGYNNYFTVAHEMAANDSVQFLESWIKEAEEDKSVALGINEPIGTLFMKVKINSELLWKNIKSGNLNGFSVELDASMIKSNLTKQTSMDFTKILKSELTNDEVSLRFNSLEVGETVIQMNEEGVEPTMFSGKFQHEGNEYTAVDGSITEVVELQADNDTDADLKAEVSALKETVNGLVETMTNLFGDLKPKEGETVADMISSFEAFKLSMLQGKADQDAADASVEDENQVHKFNADDYHARSNWGL